MIHDKDLEEALVIKFQDLLEMIQDIGPSDLRQYIDEKVIMAYNALNKYDQSRSNQIDAEWTNYVSPTMRSFEWE